MSNQKDSTDQKVSKDPADQKDPIDSNDQKDPKDQIDFKDPKDPKDSKDQKLTDQNLNDARFKIRKLTEIVHRSVQMRLTI